MLTKISGSTKFSLFEELKSLDASWIINWHETFRDSYSDDYVVVSFSSFTDAGKFATKIANIVRSPIRVNISDNGYYNVIFRCIQTLTGSERLIGECKFTYKEFLKVICEIE